MRQLLILTPVSVVGNVQIFVLGKHSYWSKLNIQYTIEFYTGRSLYYEKQKFIDIVSNPHNNLFKRV